MSYGRCAGSRERGGQDGGMNTMKEQGVRLKGHAPGCECEPHETFVCPACGRRVGYCLGAYDNMPDVCDFCWYPEDK